MKRRYPVKILIAWGESISGNVTIRNWLISNGYPELAIFVFALHNKDDARKWLLKNGHPHFLATIEGAEGKEEAIEWLNKNGFDILAKVARAGGGDEEAFKWLMEKDLREMAVIAKKIEFVKDGIEADNNDPHKISKE